MANNKFKVKLRHTGGITEKLDDAREILAISSSITEEMQELLQHLAKIKVKDETVEQYFNNLILNNTELTELAQQGLKYDKISTISTRKKNVLKSINRFYHTGVGQSGIQGTAYGAYNAVNGYLSNIKKYSSDNQMESLVLGGTDYKLNNKALDLALTLNN